METGEALLLDTKSTLISDIVYIKNLFTIIDTNLIALKANKLHTLKLPESGLFRRDEERRRQRRNKFNKILKSFHLEHSSFKYLAFCITHSLTHKNSLSHSVLTNTNTLQTSLRSILT